MEFTTFPTDLEIAQEAPILHIRDIAAKLGISSSDLEYYGKYKAKLPLRFIDEGKIAQHHLILVTAITPTPAGEGKTTVSIGLSDGLNKLGYSAMAVLREPSLGPVFGMKGGAAGGGFSQVIPMIDINLHFTGDFAAIEKSNNLLSALIDNNIQNQKRSINIDPRTISWKRVIDMNDRALRHIVIGLGGSSNGIVREDGFNITPASEVMAILCLSENLHDLKERLGNIYIGNSFDGKPLFARDLNAIGSMAVLLKDALKPNLVQTLEGNPAILHGGPFASIAQGTNTVIATKMGLSLSDYVVTEAGFGADLGAEKFFDIKCRTSGLKPEAVILVCTIRALRHHGGAKKETCSVPDITRVAAGLPNLEKHIANMREFGMQPIVALNYFENDSYEEIALVQDHCRQLDVECITVNSFMEGGEGATELATAVVDSIAKRESHFKPLYDLTSSIEEKLNTIATKIYGANGVEYSPKAKLHLKHIKELELDSLPVCMAKTPKSLSDDENKRGRPTGFNVTVREFEFASGAGFVIPILGDMMRMPGLPSFPAAENIDIDDEGNITGLF